MKEEILKELRSFSREHMHQIWEKLKNNELDDLDYEEKRYAKIMEAHKEEFFNQFEFADLMHDREYDPDTEVNPFLHILIHAVVETQLDNRDPVEVFQFYSAMRRKGCSHHDTLHLIGVILTPLMFDVVKQQKPFDQDAYRSFLKKYKTRKPQKIIDLLYIRS